MSTERYPSEYVTIFELPPLPVSGPVGEIADEIFIGVDAMVDGLGSYRLALSDILAVVPSLIAGAETVVDSGGPLPTIVNHVPRFVTVNPAGGLRLASASDREMFPIAAATKVEGSAATLMTSGVVRTAGNHPLQIGKRYFLQADGGLATLPDWKYTVPVLDVIDDRTLVILDDDPQPTRLCVNQSIFDLSDSSYFYYGVGYTGGRWRIRRFDVVTGTASTTTTGADSLAVAWSIRQSLSYL